MAEQTGPWLGTKTADVANIRNLEHATGDDRAKDLTGYGYGLVTCGLYM